MRVNLHIDRIVLDGLPVRAHEGPRLRAAIEAELRRLLAERGLPAPLENSAVRRGFQPFAGRDATALGKEIGRAIYERIE